MHISPFPKFQAFPFYPPTSSWQSPYTDNGPNRVVGGAAAVLRLGLIWELTLAGHGLGTTVGHGFAPSRGSLASNPSVIPTAVHPARPNHEAP